MQRGDDRVDDVVTAASERDWERMRKLLHPYVHWTDASGVTVRGRTKVLDRLTQVRGVAAPRSYEVRDDQVYRWEE